MGGFFAVDIALATQVLPDADDVAKDLGIMTMALSLPAAIAPAVAPGIIAAGEATAIGGYSVWFLFGAAVAVTGSVLVYRIRGVL